MVSRTSLPPALMKNQPLTAGSAENELIESMLRRQEEVLTGLDTLFDQIDAVIEELSEQRKKETIEESENVLPFGDRLIESESSSLTERAA
jgi:hypothetical protein